MRIPVPKEEEEEKDGMSMYDKIKKIPKEPNAVCSWCQDHYDPKDRWCDSFGKPILEPLQPRRCSRYTGEPVTVENLKSVFELLNARWVRS